MDNWAYFKKLYNTGPKDNADNFRYHFNQQFSRISFTGKNVLEVGCGRGFLPLYIALFADAATVTAVDESAGHGS
jgi:2-polyprenyl-3-methyl-5-hydroxy-6-metoxy-1,4-benzoquinol methylase